MAAGVVEDENKRARAKKADKKRRMGLTEQEWEEGERQAKTYLNFRELRPQVQLQDMIGSRVHCKRRDEGQKRPTTTSHCPQRRKAKAGPRAENIRAGCGLRVDVMAIFTQVPLKSRYCRQHLCQDFSTHAPALGSYSRHEAGGRRNSGKCAIDSEPRSLSQQRK